MPRVTAIVSYDRAPFVERTVWSLLEQTHRELDVVVLDLGTDDTGQRVDAVFGSRVSIVRCPGATIAHARNTALAATTTQYVAMSSSDTPSAPDRIARQVAALEAHPDAGLCHGAVRFVDEAWATVELPPDRRIVSHTAREGRLGRTLLLEGNPVLGVTVMLRRTVLDEVGGFDEDPAISEDFDLWLRVASVSSFVWVPEPLVAYRARTFAVPADAPRRAAKHVAVLEKHKHGIARALGVRPDEIARRARDVLVESAYQNLVAGRAADARQDLRAALRQARPTARALELWAASLLPAGARELLRSVRRALRS